ncbi:MAG: hypothetical protein OXC46_02065 [Thaumarchaeota archaeon]|nr:hypothetical protein [Nitrososphaerota archaeon]
MAESKVSGIIKSLRELEDDLDSLDGKVDGMKKQLSVKALNSVDVLLEKTREMATQEATSIIETAREQANAESAKIEQDGKSRLAETQSVIDTNFDRAVNHVVSTILKE